MLKGAGYSSRAQLLLCVLLQPFSSFTAAQSKFADKSFMHLSGNYIILLVTINHNYFCLIIVSNCFFCSTLFGFTRLPPISNDLPTSWGKKYFSLVEAGCQVGACHGGWAIFRPVWLKPKGVKRMDGWMDGWIVLKAFMFKIPWSLQYVSVFKHDTFRLNTLFFYSFVPHSHCDFYVSKRNNNPPLNKRGEI